MVRGRSVVASGAGIIAVTYGVLRFGYGLQLPQLSAEFSLSATTAGAIASGSFAAYCLVALVAQRVMRDRGARVVLWVAAVLAVSGALVVAFAPTTGVLATGVVIAGSAAGAASPALVVAVSCSVPAELAGRSQAVVNAGTGIGVALTGVVVIAASQTWRPVWLGAAVAVMVLAAVVDRCARWPVRTPCRPAAQRQAADGAGDLAGSTAGSTAGDGGGRGRGRQDPQAAVLARPLLGALAAGVGSAAVWTFGRDLLTTTGGLPDTTTAVLWVLLGAGAVLGGLSGDLVRVAGLRRAWIATVALTASATATIALLPGAVGVLAIAGITFGGAYTALSGVLIIWADAVRPQEPGRATASLFIALTAGQAAGAAVAGALLDSAGALAIFLASAGVLAAAGLFLPPSKMTSPPRLRVATADVRPS